MWSLGGRGQFGHTWNTDLGVEDSPSEGETGTWQSQPWARRERETKWVPGMVTQFPPSTCSVWPCCPWRWPVPFRWNTLGPLSSQGRGHWALSQAWGTWLHHFLPVSAWTSYFILNLSVSVSLSLNRDSNTYLIRPLEGWKLNEIMHIRSLEHCLACKC